ncbi:non-ribosomal peptide synthetase [uncultured Legionella sp.]|uniref:non-ribosomal peptide synthetase n=1 Tax=uncultured Legionella sp. TaxID=210934 RepID=UPI00262D4677|nr:non-ribosomal peptide synthetase [uncultured Legionella sp.]
MKSLFEDQAAKKPHHIAAILNNNSLTYEELNQRANQLAHCLINQGITSDTLVAVYLERSVDFLVTVLGILKAGGAYIPLDTTYPYERISLILKGSGNPLLITSNAHKKKFTVYKGPLLITSNNKDIDNQPTYNPSIAIKAEHLAYVIYTSGSTGTPKGVLIEHGAIVNYSLWFSEQYKQVKRIDFSSNQAFDMAITLYLVPLVLGITVIMCKDIIKKDPRNYLKYLNSNQIDFIKLTPSYFKVLVNETQNKAIKLPHLKKIMLGGENLTKAECSAWLSMYPHHSLYNEYGPTETTVAITAFTVDKNNICSMNDSIPIGALARNTYAYILDKELKPVADGEVGELYVGGACLARGYLNSPELTQQYFIADPFSSDKNARIYKTGDLCQRNVKHQFECLGRIDHQIKIRGFRVEPGEIEKCLSTHPALKAAVVIASTQYNKEQSLIAYYIIENANTELSFSELSDYLKLYLPEYMIPSAFIKMDSFPLNANDKLDRKALPKPQFSPTQNYVPARTRLEKILANTWAEELGISPIGIHDDFFELGGHSLSAARIISKINHKFRIELSLYDFYVNTTICDLIPFIKKAKKIEKKQISLIKKFNNDSALFPLSDFQFTLWIADTFEPKAKKLNIFTRKRIQGRLNIKKLNNAFETLLHKHEVLSYHVSRFRPGQYFIKNSPFAIIEESLEQLSNEQMEDVLKESIQQLINYSPWPSNTPQIIIRLFLLNDDSSELQLCIPHIISDDLSPDILLHDLSKFYNSNSKPNKNVAQDRSYRDYLLDEQVYLKKHLNRDISFWEDYLKDACLHTFPSKYVIENMQELNYSYSTYIEIPEITLGELSAFCARNHISIPDALCAVVALALKNCTKANKDISLCINRVKSTRENRDYDNTIGCFLRIEPIKLVVDEQTNLSTISQEIHQEVINTSAYQGCPNLVKLASISTFRKDNNIIKSSLAKTFFWLYSLIFQAQSYYKTFRVLERLSASKGDNFLININVQSSFLAPPPKEESLFGFIEQKVPPYQYDLLEINNLFDVSFLRMPDSNNPFIVISANLEPNYREAVGHEMIRILNDELTITL